ncbi:hypothetical protein EHQ68_02080 [Leptospira congkakensis]|nr:hypothetical protein EHQ68_02080 [Leptospira congkakensis]
MNYIKKYVWLPYGEKMIQIFLLNEGLIQKTICFNEHSRKSFIFNDLLGMEYLVSDLDIPSNEKEFLDLETYL